MLNPLPLASATRSVTCGYDTDIAQIKQCYLSNMFDK
jgi:hypothetical protein